MYTKIFYLMLVLIFIPALVTYAGLELSFSDTTPPAPLSNEVLPVGDDFTINMMAAAPVGTVAAVDFTITWTPVNSVNYVDVSAGTFLPAPSFIEVPTGTPGAKRVAITTTSSANPVSSGVLVTLRFTKATAEGSVRFGFTNISAIDLQFQQVTPVGGIPSSDIPLFSDVLSITLSSPVGGESIRGGSIHDIAWAATGNDIHHIHLLYSTNSGTTYQNIVSSTTDDGIYEWVTPLIDFSTMRVKAIAEDADNNALLDDQSNVDFTIDSSPPETNAILSGVQCADDWYSSDVLVTLTAADVLSGVSETKYRINDGNWMVYSSPFTVKSSLTVYYHSEDNVGNVEAEQFIQIRIDNTAPDTPIVTDDSDCVTDGSQLHASWTSSDLESGIAEYQYAIGRTPGGSDVVGWTSAGFSTEITHTGLNLPPGQTYYFTVKAMNEACLWSSEGNSDGISYQLPQIGVSPASLTFNAMAGGNDPDAQTLSVTNPGFSHTSPDCGILNWNVSFDANWLSCIPTAGDSTDETDEVTVFVEIDGLTAGIYNATITISATSASNTPQAIPVILNVAEMTPAALFTPNGGENISGGSVYGITWITTELGIHHIHLLYSTDSGATYQDIVSSTTDDGIYEWSTPLIDSSTVRVKVIAEDASNNAISEDESNADFTIDSAPPETNAILSGVQCEDDWYNSNVLVTLTAEDVLSGVKETRYRIDSDVWTLYSSPFIVDSLSTVYYHSEDMAGNVEAEKSIQVRTDTTAPDIPVVTDDGDCAADGNQLHASWTSADPESGIAEYQYAIGSAPGGNDVVDWTSTDVNTEVTVTDLALTSGGYYFAVKARNGACLWSSEGNSDGILYQLPQIAVLPASLAFNALTDGDDPDAQMFSITNSGCDILNWNVSFDADWLSCLPISGDNTGETDEVTVSVDIDGLTTGTYNAAITISATSASSTPQIIPVILSITETVPAILFAPNGGEGVKGGSVYDIRWTAPGDGIHHIHLLYSTDSGATYQDIVSSTMNDGVYEWSAPLIDFSTVRVKVVAEDVGNNSLSEDQSDADFTIDSAPPETNAALSGVQCEDDWYNSSVLVTFTAADMLSGVKETRYRIDDGSWHTYSSPLTINNLLTVYYYSEDNVGNVEAEKSIQVRVDTTAPGIPVVTDDGDCPVGNQLHASWTSADPESGITEYQYAIGSAPGGSDLVDWTSAGVNAEITHTGLSLTPGQMYYFAVKARNEACLWSSVGNSDGVSYQLPQIAASPANLTFDAMVGGDAPDAQTLTVTNSGCDILNWNVVFDADWLSCTPTAGDSTDETDEVAVSVEIDGLAAGTYNAAITINATGAFNTPQIIPVTLNIQTMSTNRSDLTTIGINAPFAVRANAEGSPAEVSWTVKNQGDDEAISGAGGWYDGIYLSTDDVLDEEDSNLTNHYRSGTLPVDATYTESSTVRIFSVSAGRYFLLVKTDNNDSINETNEENNIHAQPIDIVLKLPPVADFSADPILGKPPLEVTFTDLSRNAPASWLWSFGDGETSVLQNPVHEYTGTGDQTYTVSLTVTNPDGSNTITKENYILSSTKFDRTPPTTDISLLGGEVSNDWYKTPVQITLSATDDSSGVESINYRIAGESWQKYFMPFMISEDGDYTVEYYSEDSAGNQETVKTVIVKLDGTPPETTIALSGQQGNDDWYISQPVITLSAADAPAGVNITRYRLDDSPWEEYSESFIVDDNGEHTVEFYSIDEAENQEEIQSKFIKIDTELPTASISKSGVQGENGWYVSDVEVGCDALDSVSGVKECRISVNRGTEQAPPVTISDEGEYDLSSYVEDEAGNRNETRHEGIRLDKTPPEFGDWTHIPPVLEYETEGSFSIEMAISDAVSEVSDAQLTYKIAGDYTGYEDMSPDGQGNWIFAVQEDWSILGGETLSYKIRALDNAGNSIEDDERHVVIVKSELSVSTELIDFGIIHVDELVEKELIISNIGSAQFDVVNITTDAQDIIISETAFTVQPGEDHPITVSLTPSGVYKFGDFLIIESSTADSPKTIELSGRFPQPEIVEIKPVSGEAEGGTKIVITGSNFATGAVVQIGANQAEIQELLPAIITVKTPVGAANTTVDVLVTNPDSQQAKMGNGFFYKKLGVINLAAPDKVEWDSVVIVSGNIFDPDDPGVKLAGVNVELTFIPPKGADISRTVITGSNGDYSFIFSDLSLELTGRWGVKAAWDGNEVYSGVQSETEFEVTKIILNTLWDAGNPTRLEMIDEETISISGRIEPAPGVIEVDLIVTSPNGSSDSEKIETDSSSVFTYVRNIDKAGQWKFVLVWEGDDEHDRIVSDDHILEVKRTIGKLVILQGLGNSDENVFGDLARHVYSAFKRRRFTDDDIYYLSPESGENVDAITSRKNLEDAIIGWAADELDPDISLYIYLIGHNGSKGLLIEEEEFLTPENLDIWFDGIEDKYKDITLIVEACYSGAFIEKVSGDERIIIASSQASSFALPRYSFTNFFFDGIVENRNVKESFELALEGMLAGKELFQDQTPQLEASGDAVPNGVDDEAAAESKYIDGSHDSVGRPVDLPEIVQVAGGQELPEGESEAAIWARVISMNTVNRVWAVMVPPDYDGCQPEYQYDTPDTKFPTVDLKHTTEDRYEGVCKSLDVAGTYVALIYSEDTNGISQPEPIMLTVIKKDAVEPDGKLGVSWGNVKRNYRFALEQNYPNPFNPETWIPYQLAKETDVVIRIYDSTGLLIRRLDLGHKSAGAYINRDKAAYWDGRNIWGERTASGIYFYQLEAEGFTAVRKLVIMK